MYRKVATEMWTDQKFRALPAPGKLLFIYLFSNPHTHVGGIYYLPDTLIVRETGLKQEAVDTLWDTISSSGLACRDTENDLVWVVNMLRWQAKGEKILRAVSNHLKTLHNSCLIPQFLEKYPSVKRFYRHRVSDTPSSIRTGVSQSGKQEQEYITSTNVDVRHDVVQGDENPNQPSEANGRHKVTPPKAPSAHHELFGAFAEAWKAKYGAEYKFNDKRDGAHVKWLLKAVGADPREGRRVIEGYFADDDPWLVEQRHPLPHLISKFNKYHAKSTGKTAFPTESRMTVRT